MRFRIRIRMLLRLEQVIPVPGSYFAGYLDAVLPSVCFDGLLRVWSGNTVDSASEALFGVGRRLCRLHVLTALHRAIQFQGARKARPVRSDRQTFRLELIDGTVIFASARTAGRIFLFQSERLRDSFRVQPPHLLQPGGIFQFGGVAFMVDESVFRKHGGHYGIPQNLVVRPLLAPILQSASSGNHRMIFVLIFLRFCAYTAVKDVTFEAGPSTGIDMDADKKDGSPAISRACAGGERRIGIASPRHFYRDAFIFGFQDFFAFFRDRQRQILFFKSVADCTGIASAVTGIDENFFHRKYLLLW